MKDFNDWTIYEIEALGAGVIEAMAEDHVSIKGYDAYFVDFKGYFGYSVLVCADGRHLTHANDYELHHLNRERGELRDYYIQKLNDTLFTEDELLATATSYDERERKAYFLHNIYPQRREYESIFGNVEHEWFEPMRAAGKVIFSHANFGYFRDFDADFVRHLDELHAGFKRANDPLRSYESAFDAFKYEMYNHEYAIAWGGDWDVINCFCKVAGGDMEDLLAQTGWSDEIKRAYRDAARHVMRRCA